MDNVTHSLVGLMLGRSWGKNAAMMVVAANFPDIDVVSWAGGSLTYIEAHRGIAHSLIAAPLLALIAMLLFRNRSWQAYLLCLVGVMSHLLLDWTNTYGIRMLLPFSGRWLRLDTVDVVDPWILLAFLLAVAAPGLAGLVSSEIGAKKSSGAKRGWAWVALVFLFAYEGGRLAAHQCGSKPVDSVRVEGSGGGGRLRGECGGGFEHGVRPVGGADRVCGCAE